MIVFDTTTSPLPNNNATKYTKREKKTQEEQEKNRKVLIRLSFREAVRFYIEPSLLIL